MAKALIFLATGWGSKYGGINSFNTDLVTNLAKILPSNYKIYCAVFNIEYGEVESAKRNNVHLLHIEQRQDILSPPSDNLITEILLKNVQEKIEWIIGHDIKTGQYAIKVSKSISGSKTVVINHMDYRAYNVYKNLDPDKSIRYEIQQKEVFSNSDYIFAVGPKLSKKLCTLIYRDNEYDYKDIMIVPGLATPSIKLQYPYFSAITFGRLDPFIDNIKLASLAVSGFGTAYRKYPDIIGQEPMLTIYGLGEDNYDKFKGDFIKIAEEYAGRRVNVLPLKYSKDRNFLLNELSKHHVCLMLSLHEGFGLVGWEAISAEVPLILSKNSGIYELLEEQLGGAAIGCLTSIDILGSSSGKPFKEDDIENVAESLKIVKHNYVSKKRDAKTLKELLLYLGNYTWENTALNFAEKLNLDFSAEMAQQYYLANKPNFMMALAESAKVIAEVAQQRNEHFDELWNLIEKNKFKQHLILFGGVASRLCGDSAVKHYSKWLRTNPKSLLFICYESGSGLIARAQSLDEARLISDDSLPVNAQQRLLLKEENVRNIIKEFALELGDEFFNYRERIHLIPMKHALTFYTIILDDIIYYTPIVEKRSSLSISMKLDNKVTPFRKQIVESIYYHLQIIKQESEGTELILSINRLIAIINQIK